MRLTHVGGAKTLEKAHDISASRTWPVSHVSSVRRHSDEDVFTYKCVDCTVKTVARAKILTRLFGCILC